MKGTEGTIGGRDREGSFYGLHLDYFCPFSKHQCPICNFETRTEGRLKKHMLQSHKREQRLAFGINIQSPPPPPPTAGAAHPQQQSPPAGTNEGGGGAEKSLVQQLLASQGIAPDSMNTLLNRLNSSTLQGLFPVVQYTFDGRQLSGQRITCLGVPAVYAEQLQPACPVLQFHRRSSEDLHGCHSQQQSLL